MEELFTTSRLEVLVPEERIRLDSLDTTSATWWSQLSTKPQRKLAFFDERLYLIMCAKLSTEPTSLAPILSRLQISLEASYISPFIPQGARTPPINMPPNSASYMNRPRGPGPAQIIPPATPNPVPNTNTPDRQYAQADTGVILQTYVWGDARTKPSATLPKAHPGKDDFTIAWSEEENSWIALYELHVLVTFLQTRVSEPLLCLTTSATLRDRPVLSATSQQVILSALDKKAIPTEGFISENSDDEDGHVDILYGMEEVNLLDNLNQGTTFNTSPSGRMMLPSSRIGESVRQSAFSMKHRRNDTIESASYTAPILRKSYRKTLRTVEGVRVKMRNCFVPYVPMTTAATTTSTNKDADASVDEEADEEEEAAAGSEERTVILSVEIENSTDTGLGFVVEDVSLTISGGLAHASLIGWGPEGESTDDVFPLTLRGIDQYNLLYRVSFLTASYDSREGERGGDQAGASARRHSLSSQSTSEEMRRYVAIDLTGHPYRPSSSPNSSSEDETHLESYSSRWNCLLDLLTTQQADPPTFFNRPSEPLSANDAMPAPPSPFPASTSAAKTLALMKGTSPTTPIAPWTLPKGVGNQNRNSAQTQSPVSSVLLSPGPQSGKFTPTAPSALLAAMNANASTSQLVLDPGTPTPRSDRFPHLPHLAGPGSVPRISSAPSPLSHTQTPTTPAFPAYTVSDASNNSPVQVTSSPATHGFIDTSLASRNEIAGNMVVSVNLLAPTSPSSSSTSPTARPARRNGNILIYPHEIFSLDIFVLNLSGEVRRCEVGWPGARRRRDREREDVRGGDRAQGRGLMPLENKIRVGPLLPGACQSVRMQILPLSAGVHMIDMLTLTDVATGWTVNLRSVMTVLISEPE